MLSSLRQRSFLPTVPLTSRSLRVAFVVFVVGRLLFGLWGAVVTTTVPAPLEPDPVLRPYLGREPLLEGPAGAVLGPWQRFDTLRYLTLAQEGYDAQNSVFPPLYPLAIRALGAAIQASTGARASVAHLASAIILSNAALLLALALLYELTASELDEDTARRTVTYLVFFPVGFYLFAAYSESFFLLFTLASFLAARRDRPGWAGAFGLLAALTRLTGWALVIPLVYEYARKRDFSWRRLDRAAPAAMMPLLGLLAFFLWRSAAGLPPLADVYQQFWFQGTALPGTDLLVALRSALTGVGPRAGEFSLLLDLAVLLLLLATTVVAMRRLPLSYGLYAAAMLFFMLLPTSEVKPLYSFSRYALAFFPTFMVLGVGGQNPWRNRLILYPSLILSLFFSGQFFLWGWVA